MIHYKIYIKFIFFFNFINILKGKLNIYKITSHYDFSMNNNRTIIYIKYTFFPPLTNSIVFNQHLIALLMSCATDGGGALGGMHI